MKREKVTDPMRIELGQKKTDKRRG